MGSVQFNLLPDVKLEYIKAQRSRNLATSLAFLVSGVAIAILVIMVITVEVVQKKQLNDASASVTSASKQLSGITGLNQVLTVQNQLKTLSSLHQNKHISSRIFTYLPEITPSNVKITQTSVDLTKNTISVSGTADSQLAVNTFVDTLKFAQYKTSDSQTTTLPAFSSVVEGSFALTGAGASYTITASFDPPLFANTGQIPQIILKNQITTRSVLEDPSNVLFTGQTNTKTGSQ